MYLRGLVTTAFILITFWSMSQATEELQMTKEEYIQANHIEDIEDIVHKFANSKRFLEFLLENGHDIDHEAVENIKRKDVSVGNDVDLYVKHFTEHQNFTMIMVPINIYSLAIYDTLLFAVLEVSDHWVNERFWQQNVENDSAKAHLLSLENHMVLSRHLASLAIGNTEDDITEMNVNLHEGYISTSSINYHVGNLSDEEKKEFRRSWGLIKKVFTHNVNLNVEMNIYVFGYDDMEVKYYADGKYHSYRVTPNNIFTRHDFVGE